MVLHDFKNKANSNKAFQWRGKWSKMDKEGMWSPELKTALGYSDIYESTEARVVLPLKDFIALFNTTVVINGINSPPPN